MIINPFFIRLFWQLQYLNIFALALSGVRHDLWPQGTSNFGNTKQHLKYNVVNEVIDTAHVGGAQGSPHRIFWTESIAYLRVKAHRGGICCVREKEWRERLQLKREVRAGPCQDGTWSRHDQKRKGKARSLGFLKRLRSLGRVKGIN